MNAGRVHAVIAAGLDNPALLARWRREPDLLRSLGVDPGRLDLDALWKFVGLAAKVRHNGLRADLPLTFRLLNVTGLEIEVFASYASALATEGRSLAGTHVARTRDLLSFLEHWLDLHRRDHALLWDLIRYEVALTRLSKPASVPALRSTRRGLGPRPRASSVPRVCGVVVLHEMAFDPRQLEALLRERNPRLDDAQLGTFHFCFWRRGAAAEVHILELDELGFYLLSLADGKRSAADLSRLIGGSEKPAKGLLNALGDLGEMGILAFD